MGYRPSEMGTLVFCTGSHFLAGRAERRPMSQDAKYGIAAHALSAGVLKGFSETGSFTRLDEWLGVIGEHGVLVDRAMLEHVGTYVDDVVLSVQASGGVANSRLFPEAPIGISAGGQLLQGYVDALLFHGDGVTVTIWDLKTGYNLVNPERNWQLLTYALGVFQAYPNIHTIHLKISQEGPHHPDGPVRAWSVTREQMASYQATIDDAIYTAETLGEGAPTQSGPHCLHCDGKLECTAYRLATTNAVDVANWATPDPLTPEALSAELVLLKRAKAIIKLRHDALEAEALALLEKGTFLPDYDRDRGNANRRWKETTGTPELEALGAMFGVKMLAEPKPVSPKNAEDQGIPPEMLETFYERPKTAWRLVPHNPNKGKEIFGNE